MAKKVQFRTSPIPVSIYTEFKALSIHRLGIPTTTHTVMLVKDFLASMPDDLKNHRHKVSVKLARPTPVAFDPETQRQLLNVAYNCNTTAAALLKKLVLERLQKEKGL